MQFFRSWARGLGCRSNRGVADSSKSSAASSAAFVAEVDFLPKALEDAELLLRYAAESGIEVEPNIRDEILSARLASDRAWDQQTGARLLSALTYLTAKLKPVTAESVRACAEEQVVHRTLKTYRTTVIVLACVIVPFSVVSFITTALSDAMRKDIDTANALAVKLSAQLGAPKQNDTSSEVNGRKEPPPGVAVTDAIAELQQFAATTRAIYGRARQLRFFVGSGVRDPFERYSSETPEYLPNKSGSERSAIANIQELIRKFTAERPPVRNILELPPGLPDLPLAATNMISVYQEVRYFAQTRLELVSIWYGAIAACILPVLYALLGACAYLLRLFEEQFRNRTFIASKATTARFVIAAIGGGVVGLFNNFNIAQGPTLPPLAIAFLVGYAVDVFFAFLELLIQTFGRPRGNASTKPPSASAKS